ncbi:ABC transporter permease [Steroidobacter sp.]|uniref:ABC transporter permease n=1 Tax=Steroidobacter sp. TaxID=1978227 RepID=UPI001A4DCFF7|nr:ABC transporter permease [Steroidobacter sp.]MBL8267235.1 ABC transporter permease [Steroidobacter sp.]
MAQLFAIVWLNLKNVPQRLGSSFVIVIAITGVVAVLLSVMALAAGFRNAIDKSASAERAIVLSRGSEVEAGSNVPRATATVVTDAPGIRRNADGRAIASAETLIIAPVARKSDGLDAYVTLRGVGPQGLELRPEIRIIAGRAFSPAVHEVIVGKAAAARFAGLDVGNRILLRGGEWTVVGIFESGGSSHESTLLADAETVLTAYRGTAFNSVTVQLSTPADFDAFKTSLTTNPAVEVDVYREPEYVARASKPLNRMLDLLAYSIGGIMGLGALFGALNAMYSAVSSRGTEIATLRALGFGSATIVSSVLIEALLLALLGAAVGVAIACAGFNGRAINMIGSTNSPSQLVYQLSVTFESIALGVGLAVLLGLVGGLLPALRAARVPIATGLRPR